MKGFKDTTKTQMGHGSYDEVPTRPATSKDVAAAKAVRINTPGKSRNQEPDAAISLNHSERYERSPVENRTKRFIDRANRESPDGDRPDRYLTPDEFAEWTSRTRLDTPKVTTSSIKAMVGKADKPKRFAVGGPVSSGMPAQGKPITNMNANDARTAPPMQNGQRPMINRPPQRPAPRPARNDGLPQAWRDNYAADRASRFAGQDTRSTGTPPPRPTPAQISALPTTKAVPTAPYNAGDKVPNSFGPGDPRNPAKVAPIPDYDDMAAARSSGALAKFSADRGYKRGGKVVEKGSKEVYTSKAAMKKHEAKESKSEQRAERKQEGGELLAGRTQSLRDMVGKPAARAGYAQGGKPKSKWS